MYLIEKGKITPETLSRLARGLADLNNGLVEIPANLDIARILSLVDVAQVADMPDRIIAATALAAKVPVINNTFAN